MQYGDLDILLFVYSEKYFTTADIKEFNKVLPWDKARMGRLIREGWFEVFRKHSGPSAQVYRITLKAERMIRSLYKKLNGEEIPVRASNANMFNKKVSYSDNVYKNMIFEMNKSIQQQRHQTHEE